MTGRIFDIKRYSIHDGPGIRTTVFFKGCPLHCLWCHNPESIDRGTELMHWPSRCSRCYACIAACPPGAISKDAAGAIVIDKQRCDLCGKCTDACLYDAMQLIGFEMSVGDVVKEVLKDRIFYEQSGGGVTFSGGDPLTQPEFLEALLAELRSRGIRTAVDTAGTFAADLMARISALTDLFLYDLKFIDDTKHREFTGVSNVLILENLKRLTAGPAQVWVRIPLIAGINDDGNINSTITFLRALNSIKSVGLLPYHSGGKEKAKRLGKESYFRTFEAPSDTRLAEIETAFRGAGFEVQRGG